MANGNDFRQLNIGRSACFSPCRQYQPEYRTHRHPRPTWPVRRCGHNVRQFLVLESFDRAAGDDPIHMEDFAQIFGPLAAGRLVVI